MWPQQSPVLTLADLTPVVPSGGNRVLENDQDLGAALSQFEAAATDVKHRSRVILRTWNFCITWVNNA
jgi:hypothetical protein